MLSVDQLTFFGREGYLVIEDVFDQAAIVDPVRAEYQQLLDRLYNQWYQQGRVGIAPDGLSFEEKLKISYAAKCDWFQPMDISLPGDRIYADTPMHFGPAIFDLVTDSRLLDLVEDLIGAEITSNPIPTHSHQATSTGIAGGGGSGTHYVHRLAPGSCSRSRRG